MKLPWVLAGTTLLCLVACTKATPPSSAAGEALAWQCEAGGDQGTSAAFDERPTLASVLSEVREGLRSEHPEVVADAVLRAGYWEPAIDLLEAALGEEQSPELNLLYGRALAKRAVARCSVLDALHAAWEFRSAMGAAEIRSKAAAERMSVLELLGLTTQSGRHGVPDSGKGEPRGDHVERLNDRFRSLFSAGRADKSWEAEATAAADDSPWLAARALERYAWRAWGRSILDADREAADRQFTVIEIVASRLSGRDPQPMHDVEKVRNIWTRLNPARQRLLAEGLVALGAGIDAYEDQRFATAAPLLERAQSVLSEQDLALAHWAHLYLAIGRFYLSSSQGASEFHELAEVAEARGFRGLAGRARWLEGTALLQAEEFRRAIEAYHQARRELTTAGGAEAAGFVDVLQAEATSMAGDYLEAWRLRFDAFRHVPEIESTRRQIAMYWEAATALDREGLSDLKGPLLDRAVELSDQWGEPLGVSTARLERAHWLVSQGLGEAADADLLVAEASIHSMEPGSLRSENELTLQIEKGLRVGLEKPARGAAMLGVAASSLRQTDNKLRLLEVLSSRVALSLAAGSKGEAIADLNEGLVLFERAREGAATALQRDELWRRARPSLDRLIEIEFDGDGAQRLPFEVDRLRSRAISEARLTREQRASALADWEVPIGVAVLIAHSTPRETFFWMLSDDGSSARVRLGTRMLEGVASRFRALSRIGAPESELQRPLARLHDLILKPLVAGDLPRLVVFVPDSQSVEIPVHAMFDEGRNRYLIEDSTFTLYPSLTTLAADLGAGGRRLQGESRPIIVGVQGAGESNAAPLARLAHAEVEARKVGSMLPNAVVLVGDSANRKSLDQGLRSGAGIFHFAGHAVSNPVDPRASFLLLVGGDRWSPGDAPTGTLSRFDLVVLSGCSTLDPSSTADSAIFGLAGAFFAAGAGAVIGTGEPLDDRVAASLTPYLYRTTSPRGAADRLAAAIRTALREGGAVSSPGVWATWRVLGGLASAENSARVRPN